MKPLNCVTLKNPCQGVGIIFRAIGFQDFQPIGLILIKKINKKEHQKTLICIYGARNVWASTTREWSGTWVTTQPTQWLCTFVCEFVAHDVCIPLPCHNNQSCSHLDSGDFYCNCSQRYYGPKCEHGNERSVVTAVARNTHYVCTQWFVNVTYAVFVYKLHCLWHIVCVYR